MESARGRLFLGFFVIGAALLPAWWWTSRQASGDITSAATTIAQPTTTARLSDNGRVAVAPAPPAMPLALTAVTASSFTAAVANLNQADAAYVKGLNSRLFGALDYRSLAELQWKLERGFPTIEQVIALRGQPPPPKLTDDQLGKLNFDELKKYLLAWTLAQPNADDLADQYADGALARTVFLSRASVLLSREVDTPFPAYVGASLVPSSQYQKEVYSNTLVHAAIQAAQYGDIELGDTIRERLGPINPEAAGVVSLIWAYGLQHAMAQVQPCRADRYTGNPRSVGLLRRRNAQAVLDGVCNK